MGARAKMNALAGRDCPRVDDLTLLIIYKHPFMGMISWLMLWEDSGL